MHRRARVDRPTPRHPPQASHGGAAKQSHQNCLQLVVGVMGHNHAIGGDPLGHGFEPLVSLSPCFRFGVADSPRRRREVLAVIRKGLGIAQRGNKFRIPLGFAVLIPKMVLNVGHLNLPPAVALPSERPYPPEKGHRVCAATDAEEQVPVVRDATAAHSP